MTLKQAIQNSDLKSLNELLNQDSTQKELIEHFVELFSLSIKIGNVAIAKRILQVPTIKDKVSASNHEILFTYANKANELAIGLLLEFYLNESISLPKEACQALLQIIINKCFPMTDKTKWENDRILLLFALHLNEFQFAHEMIAKGAKDFDISSLERPYRGVSALWLAISRQQWKLVRILLDKGAKNFDTCPVEGPNHGISALWLAAVQQQWDLVGEMILKGALNFDTSPAVGSDRSISVLWLAAFHQQWDLVGEMILKGALNFDTCPAVGSNRYISVLWLAAHYHRWDLVRTMIAKDAKGFDTSPAEGTNSSKSALWLAAFRKQWDLVREMLAKGANNFDIGNPSVLWITAYHKQWDLVCNMVNKGAKFEFDPPPKYGTTIYLAVVHARADMVDFLFAHGASIDGIRDLLKITDLNYVFQTSTDGSLADALKRVEALEKLFKIVMGENWQPTASNLLELENTLKALNPTALNAKKGGKTALQYAFASKNSYLVEEFLCFGAELDIRTNPDLYQDKDAVVACFAQLQNISNDIKRLEELASLKDTKESKVIAEQQNRINNKVKSLLEKLEQQSFEHRPKAHSYFHFKLCQLLESEVTVKLIPPEFFIKNYSQVGREVSLEHYKQAKARIAHYLMVVPAKLLAVDHVDALSIYLDASQELPSSAIPSVLGQMLGMEGSAPIKPGTTVNATVRNSFQYCAERIKGLEAEVQQLTSTTAQIQKIEASRNLSELSANTVTRTLSDPLTWSMSAKSLQTKSSKRKWEGNREADSLETLQKTYKSEKDEKIPSPIDDDAVMKSIRTKGKCCKRLSFA